MNQTELRNRIRHVTHQDEHQAVTQLLHSNPLSSKARKKILHDSRQLVNQCRADKTSSGTLDAFLLEFGLSNAEGVALMCLAEALLRVPDALTADRLIAEKIRGRQLGCPPRQIRIPICQRLDLGANADRPAGQSRQRDYPGY